MLNLKYKSLVIICLTAFLLSIICVSATDVNNQTISNGKTEIISYSQEDMLTVADDNGTFTSLQNKINNDLKGNTITLDRDYTYDEGFNTVGIVIDKDLTIDGNGHTLNELSKSRIILIKLGKITPNKVTIKILKFINGNTNLYGGAIFNYADLKIDNCQFTNNYAKYCGGAINSVGNLECMNSKFDKNIANGDGGAIFTLSLRGTLANILKKNN